MSVTGGPTSNTEFEVLSRSSLQFFPYGSVPYTQYLKQNIPSIPEMLKNQENPYYTVAYHSYYASGYNRNSVYDYMGFDRKEFEENFFDEKRDDYASEVALDEYEFEDLDPEIFNDPALLVRWLENNNEDNLNK